MNNQTPSGIDLELFMQMQALMEDEFAELLQTYLDDTPNLLTAIHGAIIATPADLVALTHAAHQLKSTSASLGFTELEQLGRTLEQFGGEQTGGDPAQLHRQADESFARLLPFIQHHID